MSVTRSTHDFTGAARNAVLDDLDRIVTKVDHDASVHGRLHTEHAQERARSAAAGQHHAAAHHAQQAGAARDAAAFKTAKAAQLRWLLTVAHAMWADAPVTDVAVDERAVLLDRLAQQANERSVAEEAVFELVTAWTPDVDDNKRLPAWEDLCEAVRLRDGLASREIDFRTATDVTGMGAEDRAHELAVEQVDAALWPLLRPGSTRCVDCVGTTVHVETALPGKEVCDRHLRRRQAKVSQARTLHPVGGAA